MPDPCRDPTTDIKTSEGLKTGQKIISLGWQFQLNCYGVSNDAKFISIDGKTCIQNVAWSTPFLATYNVVIDAIEFINKNK